jgi:predicted regulator of Ras-like GTPase activity (Roadblock/LC7/MglB family)
LEVQVPFKKILQKLVESVPGANGAILADWEGEAVEQFSLFDEFEMKVIGAHKGIILSRLRELHAGLPVGEIEEVMIATEICRNIIAAIGPDYTLVVTLDRAALPALALLEVRKAVELLKKEIC